MNKEIKIRTNIRNNHSLGFSIWLLHASCEMGKDAAIFVLKFLEATFLNKSSAFQHKDFIAFLDSTESVSDDDGSSVTHNVVKCYLNFSLRGFVKG
jgi:hypothetical protein